MQEEEREAVAGQEVQGQHFPVHAFQQFQHPGADTEFLHIVGPFDVGHEAAEVMVGHDEQGGQHGRHADGAEVAADEGHTGITVAGAVHAHEEDGHEEAEVAQGRDQQARHHQGQDGGREQDLLQQPGGQVEDERSDAEHGHDEGDVPVGHQTGRPVGQTAQDVPQGGHGRAVVDEGDVVAEPVVGDPARGQQEQRQDEVGTEDVDDLGLVEAQGGELAFPAVHEVEQIAGDEDEVDGGGVEKTQPQAVLELGGVLAAREDGAHPHVGEHDGDDGEGPEIVEGQVIIFWRHAVPLIRPVIRRRSGEIPYFADKDYCLLNRMAGYVNGCRRRARRVWRVRVLLFLTAMCKARLSPTSTTSFLPRVTPV